MGVLQTSAEMGSFSHNRYPVRNSSIKFIQTSNQVHVSADVDELLWKIDCVFHQFLYFPFHLHLHLDDVYIKLSIPFFSTFFVRSLSLE
jgi:hypothetical protein